MTEARRSKQEIWKETHAQRVECPDCDRFVSLRTLRWRHVCGRRSLPQRLLDAQMAELRRQDLSQLALTAHEARKKRRSGGEPPESSSEVSQIRETSKPSSEVSQIRETSKPNSAREASTLDRTGGQPYASAEQIRAI